MDNAGGIKLFKNDNGSVALPSVSTDDLDKQQALKSQKITEVLAKEMVKTLLLPEDKTIADENYIFDFSEVESISVFKKEALKSLISKSDTADISLYLYRKNGLVQFGKGDRYYLERIIPIMLNNIFGDEIKVYKNFKQGEPLVEVKERDITKLRLNL